MNANPNPSPGYTQLLDWLFHRHVDVKNPTAKPEFQHAPIPAKRALGCRPLFPRQCGCPLRILFDPHPRTLDEILSRQDATNPFSVHEVIQVDTAEREQIYAEALPETQILISQQSMDHVRLDSAPKLRAIFNVETNFLPNIDYERCFERGIHVLAPARSSRFRWRKSNLGWLCRWRETSTPVTANSSAAGKSTGGHELRSRNYCRTQILDSLDSAALDGRFSDCWKVSGRKYVFAIHGFRMDIWNALE